MCQLKALKEHTLIIYAGTVWVITADSLRFAGKATKSNGVTTKMKVFEYFPIEALLLLLNLKE